MTTATTIQTSPFPGRSGEARWQRLISEISEADEIEEECLGWICERLDEVFWISQKGDAFYHLADEVSCRLADQLDTSGLDAADDG